MLARLQQMLVAAVIAGVVAWVCLGVQNRWPPLLIAAGAVAGLMPHAWILALEFVALARVEPGSGLPRPRAKHLIEAWWGEVWTGLRVFAWRQPFHSGRLPDYLPGSNVPPRRGVVLVHGFVCNRGLWNPWMRRLRQAKVPHVAVNLEPVFGSIDRYTPIIEAAVQRVEQNTGTPPVVVAHSMGGLAVRTWLRAFDADARIHRAITIASPHHGTWMARFAVTSNTRQMQRGGDWTRALAAAETASRRARFTCFFSHCDNIVFPAETSMLAGADNRHLPGYAHVHLVDHPAIWSEVTRWLDMDSGTEPTPTREARPTR